MTLPQIIFDNVSFRNNILSNISFAIMPDQVTCLLGASGSGKSTILRIIAGLNVPSSGIVSLRGQLASQGNQMLLRPQKRNIALMFQDYALIPFMTIWENILFAIKTKPSGEQKQQAEKILQDMGLWHYRDKSATQLSGGEQQRLALARALMQNTDIVMLDEPFSNLDSALRRRLREETLDILRQYQKTVIMVTHDPSEAFLSADHIIYLQDGKIIQSGSSEAIYYHPDNLDIAAFSGAMNIAMGIVQDNKVQTEIGQFPTNLPSGSNVVAAIRHEGFKVAPLNDAIIRAEIIKKEFAGGYYRLTLKANEQNLVAEISDQKIHAYEVGDEIGLNPNENAMFLFKK